MNKDTTDYGGKLFQSEITLSYSTKVSIDAEITAVFAKEKPEATYTVTFNGNGGKNGKGQYSTTLSAHYKAGADVDLSAAYATISAFTKSIKSDYSENYRISGWNTKADGTGIHYDKNAVMQMPAENLTLYAEWEGYEWIHWIAKLGEGGESITHTNGKVTAESAKFYCGNSGNSYGKVPQAKYTPVTATPKEGYKFVGWYDGDTLINAKGLYNDDFKNLRKITMAESGSVLEARFEKLPVVTYTDGVEDEELFADQVYYVEAGEPTPAFEGTVPDRENYVFAGWSPEIADTVSGDVTYVAQWTPTTKNAPAKKYWITQNKVNQMQIRAYAEGTEYFNMNNEMFSCSPSIYASGVETVISDIYGNDADGYYTDITFKFKSGDKFEAAARNVFNTNKSFGGNTGKRPSDLEWKKWVGNWSYSFTEDRPAEQTITLKWFSGRTQLPNGKYRTYNEWRIYYDGSYKNTITSVTANIVKVNFKLERTVTYTDGVNGEAFADQTYAVPNGESAPEFSGKPTRKGYVFGGWTPETGEKIYEDTTYTAIWNQPNKLIYNANGGKNAPSNETTLDAELTISETVPTRGAYYRFKGWNTEKDGSGETYQPGDVIKFTAENNNETITLYAQWKKLAANTLRLNGNGGFTEKGSDTYSTYTNGASTTIGANPFAYPGYSFTGWNTEADGSGTAYASGDLLNFTEAQNGEVAILYAQWNANQYQLSRNTNGGEPLEDVNVTFAKPYGDAIVESERNGYTADGWFLVTEDGITDTEIHGEDVVSVSSNHGVFQKRSIAPITVQIAVDVANGIYDGENRTLTALHDSYEGLDYAYQWTKDGQPIHDEARTGNGKTLTLEGNVSDSGVYAVTVTVTNREDSGVITENEFMTATAELTVQIDKANNVLTLKIQNDANDDQVIETTESSAMLPELTRQGYDFLGWNTEADGTGVAYKANEVLEFNDGGNGGVSVTLYAQWKGHTHKVTFRLKDDPTLSEEIALNFTSKEVTFGEKVGTFPYAKREDHILMWYDENGKTVNADTVYLVDGDSVYTGVWVEYIPIIATGDSSNIALYVITMFASIACIGVVVVLYRRKRSI